MRSAYFLQGVLFLGVIVIAAYGLQLREKSSSPSTGTDAKPIGSGTIDAAKQTMATNLSITSTAFAEGGRIPSEYTCDASSAINPPLIFSGVPEGAKSLVLIMDDPDVPKALKPDGVFDHWVLFNISPDTKGIAEGESAGTAGRSGSGTNDYVGPCPPPEYEPKEHRYVFTLYALDARLPLKEGASKQEVLKAIEGHVIERAQIIGRYSRS